MVAWLLKELNFIIIIQSLGLGLELSNKLKDSFNIEIPNTGYFSEQVGF